MRLEAQIGHAPPLVATSGQRGLVHDAMRFILLSGGCWLLDMSLLLAFSVEMHWSPALANVFSSLIAAAVVYLIAHRKIHDGLRYAQTARVLSYLCYTLAVIMLASWALGTVRGWLMPFISTPAVALVLAKIIITPPQLLSNFFVSRFVARLALPDRPGNESR